MTHPKGNLPRVGLAIARLFVLVAAAAFLVIAAAPDGAWAQQRPPTTVLNQAKTPTVPKPVNKYEKQIDTVRQGTVELGEYQATGDPDKARKAAKNLKTSPARFQFPPNFAPRPLPAPRGQQ